MKVSETFTRDQRHDIISNTIRNGALGDALEEMLILDLDVEVPETMPGGFMDGLSAHLNAWLANVQQRASFYNDEIERRRTHDYLWALIQALVLRGDLCLDESEGHYKLRRADIICNVCEEVHQ